MKMKWRITRLVLWVHIAILNTHFICVLFLIGQGFYSFMWSHRIRNQNLGIWNKILAFKTLEVLWGSFWKHFENIWSTNWNQLLHFQVFFFFMLSTPNQKFIVFFGFFSKVTRSVAIVKFAWLFSFQIQSNWNLNLNVHKDENRSFGAKKTLFKSFGKHCIF